MSAMRDRDWVKRSFMLSVNPTAPDTGTSNSKDRVWLYFTDAEFSFTNTAVGGNFTINTLPQYTPFADIPAGGVKQLTSKKTADASILGGMGRYYYESIDTWSQKVSFRFGVPEYKGLLTFFTSFYDAGAAILGRTGRMGPGLFYLAGKVVGSIIALPWTVLVFVAEAVRWLKGRPSTRYYNVKPAMALYWQRVNMIANMLASNMGITPKNWQNDSSMAAEARRLISDAEPQQNATTGALGSYAYSQVQGIYNKLFMEKGGIDVFWVANRLGRQHHAYVMQMKESGLNLGTSFSDSMKRELTNFLGTYKDPIAPGSGLDDYLKKYHEGRLGNRQFTNANGETFDVLSHDPLNFYMNEKLSKSDPLGGSGDLSSLGTVATGNDTSGTTTSTNTAAGTSTQNANAQSLVASPSGTSNGSSVLGKVGSVLANTIPGVATARAAYGAAQAITGTVTGTGTTQSTSSTATTNQAQQTTGATATGVTASGTAESSAGGDENDPSYLSGKLLADDASDDNYIWSIFKEKEGSQMDPNNPELDIEYGWGEKFAEYAMDVAKGGGQWVNFRVEPVKSISESFQNNTAPSEIQGRINGASSMAAELRFSLSDLNTGFAPLDGIITGIRNTFLGLADGLHISGVAALMGSGQVDIPERWTDSSVQLPTAQYVIKCRPAYGNLLSRYLNMHFVIACLLAGVLPISYGRQAYGSPFLCEFYASGKNQSRLAIIDSLSITRGEGNLGWTQDGDFLGCDITFSVKDLSTIMHAPVDSGLDSIVSLRWLIADDNVFNDYMAVLSNLSVTEMTYSWEKLKRNWTYWKVVNQSFLSPSRMAMAMGDTMVGRVVRKVTPSYALNVR